MKDGLISFFVFEPSIFKYLKNDKTYLERDPMIKISQKGQLIAFKHYGLKRVWILLEIWRY